MSPKLYYIIYRTTNISNKRYYIGIHLQRGLEFDGYLGSGKAILQAISKMGRDNFVREIIFFSEDIDVSLAKEAELVTLEFISKRSNYNLCPGGLGYNISLEIRRRQERTKLSKYGNIMGQCHTPEVREKGWKTKESLYGNKCGQCHTPEALQNSRDTFESRYGSFISVMKSESSMKKRSEKLRGNYLSNKPELLDICKMYNPSGELETTKSILELGEYMSKISGYSVNPRIILSRYKTGEPVKQGPWKGYVFLAR